jgi:glutamate/tyrosine decarboxylase-like PLP-dependent enzyme
MAFNLKEAFLGRISKESKEDFVLNHDYLEKLSVIEIGALNGEILDDSAHFNKFFPTIKSFLKNASKISKNPNKTMNLDYLDYGVHVPQNLSKENDAIDYVLPFYNSIDSRSGVDWRNVLPITILPAVLGAFGAALINPNLVTSKYGKRANELEVRVVKSLAKILGYKELDKAWGLALEGSTKGNMYGYLLGLRKAFPQIKEEGLMGLQEKFLFANSQAGHFSNFTNLAAIGTGRKNAMRIPANKFGCIKIQALKEKLEDCYQKGIIVPTILLTIGTTDHCAIDDVKACWEVVEELAKKYPNHHRPHIHLDAAIGWSLTFFNDYDLDKNHLSLKESFLEKLPSIQEKCRNLHYADSITLDIHKTGFAPYSSSFLIVKNIRDFENMMWGSDEFKYFDPSKDQLSPVQYSLECTRSSSGVYATAMALKSLGIEGYQTLLAAGLQYSHLLKEKFVKLGNIAVVNPDLGFTCLFRPYPSFISKAQDLYEREIHDPDFHLESSKLNSYMDKFYKFWQKHKSPSTPLLDFVATAAWSQYGSQDYELPSWKAYMLNPRVGKHMKAFMKEFLALRAEFERLLPEEELNELKTLCRDFINS